MRVVLFLLLLGLVSFPTSTLEAAGQTWSYSYLAPEAKGKLPLVLLLHGAGGSAGYYLEKAGWAASAREHGFLVVAPEGLPIHPHDPPDFQKNPRVWNTGQLGADEDRRAIDDYAFLGVLLDEVEKRWPVDPDRVYCTGHSNGGDMTFRLAAHMPDHFAAIATVSSLCPDVSLEHPVPTLCLIGRQDPMIPIAGGEGHNPWGTSHSAPVVDNMARWARTEGYSGRPEHESASEIDYGPDFTVRLLEGQGHNWPGSLGGLPATVAGPNAPDVKATELIWGFFQAHRRKA